MDKGQGGFYDIIFPLKAFFHGGLVIDSVFRYRCPIRGSQIHNKNGVKKFLRHLLPDKEFSRSGGIFPMDIFHGISRNIGTKLIIWQILKAGYRKQGCFGILFLQDDFQLFHWNNTWSGRQADL